MFIFVALVLGMTALVLVVYIKTISAISELQESPAYKTRQALLDEGARGSMMDVSQIDTSTWKTYRNDKYGFEVRYPSDFLIDIFSQSVVIYEKGKSQVTSDSPIDPYGNGLTLVIYERGKDCGDCNVFQLEKVMVNDYYAVKAITNNSLTTSLWIYNHNKDHVLRINYGYPPNKKSINNDQLFNLILSAFKFTK